MVDLLSFLDTLLGSHKAQGRHEYLWYCPSCSHHKPKLAINIATGNWHCWVCKVAGRSIFSLLKMMNAERLKYRQLAEILGETTFDDDEDDDDTAILLPAEYKPLWIIDKDPEYKHALHYLKRRGITSTDVLRYQLGYCSEGTYRHRIIIPSFDKDGRLNYFTARAYREDMIKYRNPPASKNVVAFESLVSWKWPIVICEGPFDAIAIRRNAIPLFGSSLPSKLLSAIVLNEVKDVYLALDANALKESLDMAKILLDQDVNVHIVKLDEKDPSELGFSQMIEKIETSTDRLTFGDLVKAKVSLL